MPLRLLQLPSLAPVLLGLALAACEINLAADPPKPTTVELTPDRVTLSVGDSTLIKSNVRFADLSGRLNLASLDPEVATVSQLGQVKALRPGTTLVVGTWTGRMLVADTSEVTVVP